MNEEKLQILLHDLSSDLTKLHLEKSEAVASEHLIRKRLDEVTEMYNGSVDKLNRLMGLTGYIFDEGVEDFVKKDSEGPKTFTTGSNGEVLVTEVEVEDEE